MLSQHEGPDRVQWSYLHLGRIKGGHNSLCARAENQVTPDTLQAISCGLSPAANVNLKLLLRVVRELI